MIRSTFIALAAVASLGVAMASSAEARTRINLDIGINLGGAGLYLGPRPYYYDPGYYAVESDCRWLLLKHRKWNRSHTRKVVFFTKEYVCD